MHHSKQAILYAFSIGFERASYYGVRSVLIFLMIGETLKLSREEALSIYGVLTISIVVSKVIGSLLGDLLIGNKRALIIGGIIQAAGCLIFCFQSLTMLYTGIVFFVIGSGLLNPNVIAQFGKQYVNKPKALDAGFTGLYFMMNIGAGLGSLAISANAENKYNYGFILGALFVLLSIILSFLAKDDQNNKFEARIDSELIKKVSYVFIAIILSGVFWLVYEVYSGITMLLISDISLEFKGYYNLSLGFGIIFGLILTIVWTFFYTNQFFKFLIGFLFSALSVLLIFFIPENAIDSTLTILMISTLLLTLGEALVGPMLYSIITKYSNPKYLAIIISVSSIPFMFFNKIAGIFGEKSIDLGVNIVCAILVTISFLFALLALLVWFFQKREETKI